MENPCTCCTRGNEVSSPFSRALSIRMHERFAVSLRQKEIMNEIRGERGSAEDAAN